MSHSRARQFHSVKIFIYPTSCRSWQILYRACNLRALILLFLSARSITVRDCRLFQRSICPSRGRRRGREGGRSPFRPISFSRIRSSLPKKRGHTFHSCTRTPRSIWKIWKNYNRFLSSFFFFFCWRQKRNNAINATRFSRLRSRLDSTRWRWYEFSNFSHESRVYWIPLVALMSNGKYRRPPDCYWYY